MLTVFAKKLHYFSFVFLFISLIFLHIHQVSALATSNVVFATGGTVTTLKENGITYKVHTFTASSTFTVLVPQIKVWYLVIGGGGGGQAGGGGAGGYNENGTYSYPVNKGSYPVTIGAGGFGLTAVAGTSGGTSTFSTIVSIGGGTESASGGSGGGGGCCGHSTAGSGTTGQGNNGGAGGATTGGGGGGAGAVGSNSSGTAGGAGGAGRASTITGSSVTRAGGGGGGGNGGGGAGGSGGGGAGSSASGTSGTPNTGSGGGGLWNNLPGGDGGSGIVIIRYPITTTSKPIQKGGLVGYWTFDTPDISGTTVYDRSGNRNNGTSAGSPIISGGKIGQSFNLNGTGYVSLVDSLLPTGSTARSVSMWVKVTSSATQVLLSYGTEATGRRFLLYLDSAFPGKISFDPFGEGPVSGGRSNTAVNNGQWRHVVFTIDSSKVGNFYLDGVADGSHTYGTIGSLNTLANGSANIGAYHIGNASVFTGSIDDVRVYNRVLSATEVAQLYRSSGGTQNVSPTKGISSGLVGYWTFDGKYLTNATATDSTGNGNNGTRGGTTVVNGKLGQALRFNGSSDYVRITNSSSLNTTSALTYSYWIKGNSWSSTPDIVMNALQGHGPTSGAISSVQSDGTIFFQLRVGGSCCQTLTSAASLSTNKWYHVVNTWNGSTMRTYINGVQDSNTASANGTLSVQGDTFVGTNSDSFLGTPSNFFNGIVDDVRIYNRALSATEVVQLYKMGAR